MIDINELRMVLARHGTSVLNEDEILELLDRLEAVESDALEQARLLGMGSSREAALMAKLEAAEKERDDVAMQLAQSEQGKRKISEECDALLARIKERERQEPVGTLHDDGCFVWRETAPPPEQLCGLEDGALPRPRRKRRNQMSTEFKREERYIVFKLSDVERYLTDADRTHLAMMKNEIDAGRACANKPPFKGLIVESDWPEYEPTWKAIEARVTGAQPAPSFADAYQGAMEEVAIWKKRALEAEELNRKFIAEINGPTHMGEPAQPMPNVPDSWKLVPAKHPTFDPVDLQLSDGSVLCGCVPQLDGDYWWEGPSGEVFIDPRYAPVTHWRLSALEAKP